MDGEIRAFGSPQASRAGARTSILGRFFASPADLCDILALRSPFWAKNTLTFCLTCVTLTQMARSDATMTVTLPNEPIPVTIGGEQKYVDPKDLVLSGDEKEELQHNRLESKHSADIKKLVQAVYDNAAAFIFDTLQKVTPNKVLQSEDPGVHEAWLNECGFESIQDGLSTYIRMKVEGNMKVIRSMHAHVPKEHIRDVEIWIRKEAKLAESAKSKE